MTKNSYVIRSDAVGREYITQNKGESDKNHTADDGTNETTGEGDIYATGGEKCPVGCFRRYIALLHPEIDDLWQHPRTSIGAFDKTWYKKSPMGEKHLGKMLGLLSSKYELSIRYTNRSIRVTSMQVMEDGGVESRDIQRVSGHKYVDSVTSSSLVQKEEA